MIHHPKTHKTVIRNFEVEELKTFNFIKQQSQTEFSELTVVNNVLLIMKKIQDSFKKAGTYVECGVFKGGTLIPVINYISSIEGSWNVIGADSFNGFPEKIKSSPKNGSIQHKNDLPSKFIELHNSEVISKDHYNKASDRTNGFTDVSHLKSEYFNADFTSLFNFCNINGVSLLKGKFKTSLEHFNGEIDVLYLDCDLYESYLEALSMLYSKVVIGGSIIFDEYYSHKYPGARIAVNEFFEDKKGYFEKYITSEKFERWCFIKE